MAIKRAKRCTNFTMISNVGLRDERLSFKSKGLLAYMLSLPDDWIFYESELVKHSIDGKASVKSGLKELQDAGYLTRERSRDGKGRLKESIWEISDEPMSDFPTLDKPMLDNPTLENQPLLNTNHTKDLSKQNTNKKSRNSSKLKYDDTSIYLILSYELYELILSNNSGAKEPNFQKWADDFRKMIEIDERDEQHLREVMEWSQRDSFWKGNILSANKLRQRFDQLAVQSNKVVKRPKQAEQQYSWE